MESLFVRSGYNISLIDTGEPVTMNPLRKCSPQHFHAEILGSFLRFSSFHGIFMTVRDPIARFKSEYLMQNRGNERIDIEEWADRVLSQYVENPFFLDNHLRPQSEFYVSGAYVYRQEEGFDDAWVSRVSQDLGVSLPGKLERKLVRKTLDNVSADDIGLSRDLKARLEFVYAQDFDLFYRDRIGDFR